MEAPENRRAPLVRNVILWVAFLALVAAGILTVLLPELEDEAHPEADRSPAQAADGG